MLITSLPRSVGSFFTSRSRERSNVRAVASSRSTSSRVRSAIESRWRRSDGGGGRSSSPTRWMSGICGLLLWRGQQEHLVDLVDLDELHLDSLAAGGREVLADVVGADRQLAVAAVGEHRQLHLGGPAVGEEGLDRGANGAARVEHVVDEDHRLPLEREVETRGAHDRLRALRRLSAAHVDVVAVEGDVDLAEERRGAGALLDQAAEPLRKWHAARVNADERDFAEVLVALDDLVRDPGEGSPEALCVEQDLPGLQGVTGHSTPFRPRWTGLKVRSGRDASGSIGRPSRVL